MNKEFTFYQKSILQSGKKTIRQQVIRLIIIFSVYLMSYGFVAVHKEQLPKFSENWLLILTGVYVFAGFVASLLFIILNIILSYFQYVLKSEEDLHEKIISNIKIVCNDIIAKTGIFNISLFSIIGIIDFIADLCLFIVLATFDHPLLAVLHAISTISQIFLVNSCKKRIEEIVLTFSDPLEQSEKVDINSLLDKLCESDNDEIA